VKSGASSCPLDTLLSGGSPAPSSLLDDLERRGLDRISELSSTPQDPIWHAEGSVRIHTEMVVAESYKIAQESALDLATRTALVLSAALHDIGKTSTTREELRDGVTRIISPRHARVGRSYLALRLPYLNLSESLYTKILGCVGHHHDLKSMILKDSPNHLYARLSRSLDLHLGYLLELADIRGRECLDPGSQIEYLELFRLAAIESGAWQKDPYHQWQDRIADQLGNNEDEVHYAFLESRRAFEEGLIATPEEGVSRCYGWKKNTEHAELILTCGTAGSGKTTWIRKHALGHEIISLDHLREEISGKRDDQSKNGQVFQLAKERLKDALRRRVSIVWDATSLRSDGRSQVLGLGHDYHAATRLITFATTPKSANRQNKARQHPIPTSVLERQIDRLEWPFIWEAHEVTTVIPPQSK